MPPSHGDVSSEWPAPLKRVHPLCEDPDQNDEREEVHEGRKRHTPEQILRRLAEGDELPNKGKTVAEVARAFGITEATSWRWKHTRAT